MKKALLAWIAFGLVALFCGTAGAASPAGNQAKTWDFDLTGAVKGVAYLTFRDDKTIDGYIVAAISNIIPGTTGSEGAFFVSGQWRSDEKGNVAGFLENSDPADKIRMDITSFSGKVSTTGNKFKATGVTTFGKIRFNGIPAGDQQSLVDYPFSTNWLLTLKKYPDYQTFIEVVKAQEVFQNMYFFSGATSDRCLIGWALLSAGKNIAVTVGEKERTKEQSDCSTLSGEDYAKLDDINASQGKINLRTGVAKGYGSMQGALVEGQPTPRDKLILYVGE